MSLGFKAAGFELVAGVEAGIERARTHALNLHREDGGGPHGQARTVDVNDPLAELTAILGETAPPIDVIIGGPPCQAYARVGRAKLREIAAHPEAYLHDERGSLYAAYLRWVDVLRPAAVVMENVPDIVRYGTVNVADEIAIGLRGMGYEVRYTLLNAVHHGVPQFRERLFLIAVRRELGVVPRFPAPRFHAELPVGYRGTRAPFESLGHDHPFAVPIVAGDPSLQPAVTAEDALDDLPRISKRERDNLKRGARDLSERRMYHRDPGTEYQRLMRSWAGFSTNGDVSAHVIRRLPRDYEIFGRMQGGDEYPRAYEIAEALLERRVGEAGATGARVEELRRTTVPPYDPGKFPNKWWKLRRDAPVRTLMAHLSHDSYSHIHYDSRQARTISVREAARLQSFPDGFEFCGAMNSAFGQIGNAVPPLLARAIADELRATLDSAAK